MTLEEWAESFRPQQMPWLLLGKGPSFARVGEFETGAFFTCALNHTVREMPVTLAHAIDIDVVAECQEAIRANAQFLVVPHRPHVASRPTKPLSEFFAEIPLLPELEAEGRLVVYDLSSSPPRAGQPSIRAEFFSAEAAVNLLVACGVRTIRSLGVDGGAAYDRRFADLAGRTRLAGGHDSYDLQFAGIARTLRETGIVYGPLHVETPARVFIGRDPAQALGARVLEYSIKRHASLSVEVTQIDNGDAPAPRDPRNRTRTGFSFARFRIPELCKRAGRAVYMDADMLVFGDLLELWTTPQGAPLRYVLQPSAFREARFSVMLLDCARLGWDVADVVADLDAGRLTYEQLMHDMALLAGEDVIPGLPAAWNEPERYVPGRTRLIHYTDMTTQPWVYGGNPHGGAWYAAAWAALDEGFIAEREVEEAVRNGYVSPLLPRWLGLEAGRRANRRALDWRAPYRRFGEERGLPNPARALMAGLRDIRDDHVLPQVPLFERLDELRVKNGGWRPLARKAAERLLERL